MSTQSLKISIEVPEGVRNVNTVQDAAARLREALRLSAGWTGIPDESAPYVIKCRKNLSAWIEHAELEGAIGGN